MEVLNEMVEAKVDAIDEKNGFAKRLKEVREKAGLTQRDLAEALEKEYGLKVTASSISGYEKGKSFPTLPTAKVISEKLNVSLDYLCGITETMNKNEIDEWHFTYADCFKIIMQIADLFGNQAGLDIDKENYGDAAGYPCGNEDAAVMYFKDATVVKFVSEWKKILDAYRDDVFDYKTYKMVMESVLGKEEYNDTIFDKVPF